MNVLEKILEEIDKLNEPHLVGYIDKYKVKEIISAHMDEVPKCEKCSRRKQYQTGDRVLVKNWSQLVQEFGYDRENKLIPVPTCTFVEEMKKYCGRVVEITDIKHDFYEYFTIAEDNGEYEWCSDMFEAIEL